MNFRVWVYGPVKLFGHLLLRLTAVACGRQNRGFSFFAFLYHLLISESSWYIGCYLQLGIRAKLRHSVVGTCLGRCLFLLLRSETDSGYRQQQGKLAREDSCSKPGILPCLALLDFSQRSSGD